MSASALILVAPVKCQSRGELALVSQEPHTLVVLGITHFDIELLDMGGAGFESTIGVSNSAARIVVKMGFNIAADNIAERPH